MCVSQTVFGEKAMQSFVHLRRVIVHRARHPWETFSGSPDPVCTVLYCTYHQLDSHNTHFVILIKAAMGACGSKAAEVETSNRNQSNPTEPPTTVSCVVSGRG